MKSLIIVQGNEYFYFNLERDFSICIDENSDIVLENENPDAVLKDIANECVLYTKKAIEEFCDASMKNFSSGSELLLKTFIEVLNKNISEKTVFFLNDVRKEVTQALTVNH